MRHPRRTRAPSLRPVWPEKAGGHLVSPLQPSVAYKTADPDELDALYEGRADGYTYAREGHPNADVLAGMIDELEGLSGGIITGSGMSAVLVALTSVLGQGDHLIASDQLYGRTMRLLKEELPRFGVETSFVDVSEAADVAAAIRPNSKAMILEVVSNPTLRIADIGEISKITGKNDLKLIVDNTFPTPLGFSPVEFGADIVVHSVTKLLAGHSDVTLGYVAGTNPNLAERIRTGSVTFGLTPSPFDCWLAERGLLTFKLRFRAATANAAALAQELVASGLTTQVIYPGLADHIDSARSGILKSACNMVSFRIKGGRRAAVEFMRAAAPLSFAPTLGDVTTTISHPASSSHRALTSDDRADLGIDEGFFRVSVGTEEPDLIIESILNGLKAVTD